MSMKGSEFIARVQNLSMSDRMTAAYNAVLDDAMVKWPLSKVPLGPGSADYIMAANDYFAIGTPEDFVRVPLDAPTAQRVADHLGLLLPTQRMVELTWAAATLKLEPRYQPACPEMTGVAYFVKHNQTIESQRAGRSGLISGIKKDVVISNRCMTQPRKVPICGWLALNGKAVQPLSLLHEETYADYSHGIRFMSPVIRIGGVEMSLEQALMDPAFAARLTTVNDRSHLSKPGASDYVVETSMKVTRLAYSGTLGRIQTSPKAESTPVPKPIPAPVPATAHPSSAPTKKGDIEGVAFVQAPKYTPIAGKRSIGLVVFHTGEYPEKPTSAEGLAAYFKSLAGTTVSASAHYNVDCDSIVQSVLEKDVAWAAPGANNNGIQIEHAGYAKQTTEEWNDPYSQSMLAISAKLTAGICQRHGIPVRWLLADDLLDGERGITSHAEVSKACRLAKEKKLLTSPFYGKSTNHYDPGPSFDAAGYVDLVRQFFEA